jgi:hypothetical protein
MIFIYKFEEYEIILDKFDEYTFKCPECKETICIDPKVHELKTNKNGAVTITPMVICPWCDHRMWVEGSLGIDAGYANYSVWERKCRARRVHNEIKG